jgi:sugar lactone lactonase YvrE
VDTSRAVAGLMAVAIATGLYAGTSRQVSVQAATPAPGVITTIAGATINSGPATTVPMQPWGVAAYGSTLYISDQQYPGGNVVRAVDINTGHETVVAGSGAAGTSGDGGPATWAALYGPRGLAVDSTGNLYIAVQDRVRKVDTSGIISTVVTGLSGALGVAADAAGDVFVADTNNSRIERVDHLTKAVSTVAGTGQAGFSGDTGPATKAQLWGPEGIAVDPTGTNVWIADTGNHRIREVTSGTINTVAGQPSNASGCAPGGPALTTPMLSPIGVTVDGSGNVFIVDLGAECIRELTGTTLTTVAGTGFVGYTGDGGPATSAKLAYPTTVTTDGSGNIYFADNLSNRARKVTSAGIITTIAGTGFLPPSVCAMNGDGDQATGVLICDASAVAVGTAGDVYFSDRLYGVVRKVSPAGLLSTVAGGGTNDPGDGLPATSAVLGVGALAVDGSGNLLISDPSYGHRSIRKVDTSGVIHTVAGGGTNTPSTTPVPATSVDLNQPGEIAIAPNGSDFYIADTYHGLVEKVTVATSSIAVVAGGGQNYPGDGGPATSAKLYAPSGVAVDASGSLYITDSSGSRLYKVDSSGIIRTIALPGGLTLGGLAVGPGGQVVVAGIPGQLSAVTSAGLVPIAGTGNSTFSGDGGPAYLAGIWPYAFAFDGAGDLYIADGSTAYVGRVRRIQAFVAPSAPTSVSAVASIHSATVQWAAPATNGGNLIAQYTVRSYRGATPGPSVTVSGATTAVVGGLAANVPYTFTVSAFNGMVSGPESAASAAVIPTVLTTGGDILTYAGSIGRGTATSLGQYPYSLAVAGSHLYVGDLANPVIRDVDLGTGQEGVLAGNDSYGYTGDGGMAASAMIGVTGAMAYCGGQEYFADLFNYVIRKIDSNGRITTFAGTGQFGYSGDGGPAIYARFGRVLGLACRTGGGLYVSDSDNRAVRIIDANGTINTWWWGFSFPTGITELGSQNVVAVSDSSYNVVWGLSATAKVLDGAGVPDNLNDPRGLAFLNGYLYIADRGNNVIRVVDQNGHGSIAPLPTNQPAGLAADSSNNYLYVGNIGNFTVTRATVNGSTVSSPATIAGNGTLSLSGNGGPANQAQLGNPYAVAVDSSGDLFIADNQNEVIRKVDPAGTITTIAGSGVAGNSGDGGPALAAKLNDPRGVAVAANGDVYISDTGNSSVRVVDHRTGLISTILTGLYLARALAVDASGNVYIADTGDNQVLVMRFTAVGAGRLAGTGTAGYSGDGGLAVAATLNQPRGLAVDASGNVYIADTGNNRVRRVDHVTGNITTVAGNGTAGLAGDGRAATSAELNFPFGLAVDGAGYLYIADVLNERIRVVDTRGNIDTVVGTCGGVAGFSGDGGPASIAHMNFPYGVAVDAFGDLYIAEVNSNRVRAATGLTGTRGSSCPAPAGTPGDRSTNRSHAPTAANPQIAEMGGTVSNSANNSLLPGPVSSVPAQPELVVPKQEPAAQPAPATKPGAAQPKPAVAQKPPAAEPAPAPGRAPAAAAVMSHPQSSSPRPDSFWWFLLIPAAVLTVAMTLARRRSRRMNR